MQFLYLIWYSYGKNYYPVVRIVLLTRRLLIIIFLVLDNCHKWDGKSVTLRTRSLPTHVRNKKRPFSTSDNLSELYAKVLS